MRIRHRKNGLILEVLAVMQSRKGNNHYLTLGSNAVSIHELQRKGWTLTYVKEEYEYLKNDYLGNHYKWRSLDTYELIDDVKCNKDAKYLLAKEDGYVI